MTIYRLITWFIKYKISMSTYNRYAGTKYAGMTPWKSDHEIPSITPPFGHILPSIGHSYVNPFRTNTSTSTYSFIPQNIGPNVTNNNSRNDESIDRCLQRVRSSNSTIDPIQCGLCGDYGHVGRNCMNKCTFCSSIHHKSDQHICEKCQNAGHNRDNCPTNSTGCTFCLSTYHESHQHICGKCRNAGHNRDNCPTNIPVNRSNHGNRNGNGNGNGNRHGNGNRCAKCHMRNHTTANCRSKWCEYCDKWGNHESTGCRWCERCNKWTNHRTRQHR